jgi:glycosyltransferase involved in cell wall biosynthesis
LSKISCVIITYNESRNIRRCLESVNWVDEIVVVDSYSTDDTREIASAFTDKIHPLKWSGFGPAKEYARTRAGGDWILSVDADEVVPDKLREEIQRVTESQESLEGYFIPRRSNFLGRWIRHGGWYPDLVLRLFKKEKGSFTDRMVHEEVKVSGSTGRLRSDLLHYTDPDLDHYLKKLNRYTSLDAIQLFRQGRRAGILDILLRPMLTFMKMYFFKRGFQDGLPGLILAVSSSFYVFSKYVKLWHLRETTTGEGPEVTGPS